MLLNPDLSLLTRDNVFVDDTKSLAKWDRGFGCFMSRASYTVGVPTAVLTNSGQVDLLAQHVGDDTPALLFLLHPCLHSQARYLATTTPRVELLESGDLRKMGSSLVWQRGPYDLTLPGWFVEQAVVHAALGPLADVVNIGGTRGGYLAVGFVTPGETAFQLVPAEMLLHDLQYLERELRSQWESGPLYLDEQLEEALHSGPRFFHGRFGDEGRVRLEVALDTYPAHPRG